MAHLSFAHLSYPARAKGQAAPDATGKIHERAAHERPCQPQCGEGRSAQAMANDLAERNRGKASACPLPATGLRMRRAPKAAATSPSQKTTRPCGQKQRRKSNLVCFERHRARRRPREPSTGTLFETLRDAAGSPGPDHVRADYFFGTLFGHRPSFFLPRLHPNGLNRLPYSNS